MGPSGQRGERERKEGKLDRADKDPGTQEEGEKRRRKEGTYRTPNTHRKEEEVVWQPPHSPKKLVAAERPGDTM